MAVTLLVKRVSLTADALPHRRIKSLHGEAGQMQWEHSREQVIDHIASQIFHYYFHKEGRAVRILVGQMADGELFLKTEMDDKTPDSLLQLPQFDSKPA